LLPLGKAHFRGVESAVVGLARGFMPQEVAVSPGAEKSLVAFPAPLPYG
jgi:hypothetical protein